MKTEPIKLKKQSYSRMCVLNEALMHFIAIKTKSIDTFFRPEHEKDMIRIEISIALELLLKFQQKIQRRFGGDSYSIKLEIHQSIILENALYHFGLRCNDHYKKSISDQVKNSLNQQKESRNHALKNLNFTHEESSI